MGLQNFIWNEVARGTGTLPDGRVTVSSTVEWASPDFRDDSGRMPPVASEHWSVTVYPATDRHRLIDFEIQLRALVPDLHIGGSEAVKGYGGFSPRIRLNSDQTFETESGVVEPLKTAIADGPWVNIQDGRTGFAILQSAANPNFPQPWILRKNRSMQNAVYPGADPVPLSQTSPTILRYRLVIHRGKFMAEEIRTLQTEFDSKTR